jgi:hypothetical protein
MQSTKPRLALDRTESETKRSMKHAGQARKDKPAKQPSPASRLPPPPPNSLIFGLEGPVALLTCCSLTGNPPHCQR